MKKCLCILGAGGHGKVVLEIARLSGTYNDIVFFDDDITVKSCLDAPVVGMSQDFFNMSVNGNDFFVAIGNSQLRVDTMKKLGPMAHLPVLVHPAATISSSACIEAGTVVMAGAIINPSVSIGEGCIINSNAVIEHDCTIGSFSHVSVAAALAGSVHIGDFCFIGAGSTVINNVEICSSCTIGAGAVVTKDITESGIYVGVPAKIIKPTIGGGNRYKITTCIEEDVA